MRATDKVMASLHRPRALGLGLGLVLLAGAHLQPARAQDAGAQPEDARRAQLVAQGKGVAITVGELEDYINKQPEALRARYKSPAQRQELLDTLLRLELLAAEAEQRGLADNLAVRQTVKDSAVQALVRTEIDDKVTAESISAADIKAFYDANPKEFHHAAQRRVSHIALATRAEASALLAEAQKADLRAFSELARKHSIDPDTKLRGGDLSFFTLEPNPDELTRKLAPELRKAAFALRQVGDTSAEPVEHNGMFSILRVTGERPERHVTLAEADASIRSRLWRERRQNAVSTLINTLRTREKPQVFAERVDLVKFDDMDKRPLGFAPDPIPSDAAVPPKPERPNVPPPK